MEKELDKSSENSDINASQQIKRIIFNYKEVPLFLYSPVLTNILDSFSPKIGRFSKAVNSLLKSVSNFLC